MTDPLKNIEDRKAQTSGFCQGEAVKWAAHAVAAVWIGIVVATLVIRFLPNGSFM